MKARRLLPLLLAFVAALGCQNRNQELLERELRHRDLQTREALDEQRRAEARADMLMREVEALRAANPKLSPETAALIFGLRRIVLGRGTGGYDADAAPGDEMLFVMLEPRDADEHTIKVPGHLRLEAFEINPQGLKLPLCCWDVNSEQLYRSWRQGLLSTGYGLQLPWKRFPTTENVRVVARLTLSDGRPFETDRDIKVRVMPGAVNQPPVEVIEPLPLPLPTPGPGVPVPGPAPHPAAGPHLPPILPVANVSKSASRYHGWEPVAPDLTVKIGAPSPLASPPPPLR